MSIISFRIAGACAGALLSSGCSSLSSFDAQSQSRYTFPYAQQHVAMANIGDVHILQIDD